MQYVLVRPVYLNCLYYPYLSTLAYCIIKTNLDLLTQCPGLRIFKANLSNLIKIYTCEYIAQ